MNRITLFFGFALLMFSCKTKKSMTAVVEMTDKTIAGSTVNINKIKSHIFYLASDELKGRDTPSEGLDIAAKYLATSLMRYGVKPAYGEGVDGYYQNVPLVNVLPPSGGALTFGDFNLPLPDGFLMIRGENMEVESELIFANRGTEEDLKGLDIKGKIVVVMCGFDGDENPQSWFYAGREKRNAIKAAGGKALVEIYNNAQLPYNFLVQYLNSPQMKVDDEEEDKANPFPHVWVNGSNAEAVAKLRSADGLKGSLKIEGMKNEKIKTQNIVGVLEGSDPKLKDEYIIYSAHYDHIGIGRVVEGDSIYNGSRDNAVGSVTVLSAAENLAKYPTKRSAVFIFFTGEEKGLLGSSYYADHPAIPLEKMTYCFNSDNAGYNDTTKAMIIGLERTLARPLIEKACTAFGLTAIQDNMPEQGLFDRSDNVNFAKKGVPAPTFGMGITEMDDEVNKYYHQPQDNPETLDYIYLTKFFKSYVYACRLIGNTNESVFWVEGDKYYEDGLKLYNMKKVKD
jgi:aminopeptidase YwaD